ncbi:MAG: methionine synthase [Nostocoides sp.]
MSNPDNPSPPRVRASGVGSWPGTNVREAMITVRDLLGEDLPYLPELPARGPGADLLGRTSALLVDMPVDLQPAGWRLVDRPGRDAQRTATLWREDLDELAEAYDGWTGDLKVSVAGPWTLAAGLALTRGESVLADPGATRDLVQSLAEGVRVHVRDVTRLVPGAAIVLQIDEPSLTPVLQGTLATQSGFSRIPAVPPGDAIDGLRTVLDAADGRATVVHSCHPRPPVPVLRAAGAGAVSVDINLIGPADWESIAAGVESGTGLYAGVLATDGGQDRTQAVDGLLRAWDKVGLEVSFLGGVVTTPACGLAGASVESARSITRTCCDLARDLTDRMNR